jgi:O-acetyl-ADP-ribose deacetylase (regulator of RNase III)
MKFIKGNLLASDAQALVNTVNTVGVMGKGIALQFKEEFPNNFKVYSAAVKNNEVSPGKLLVVREQTLKGDKLIVNFPTKIQWFKKSKYEYIEQGLQELVTVIRDYKIQSIAIPPLGCGNGGLDWVKVKAMILKYLSSLQNVEIQIYEPNNEVGKILRDKESKKDIQLTAPRAMLLYAMFYYESLGEMSSLFVANKLAYFLQRLGEKSLNKLHFDASHYGPYSVQVEHMLHNLNGKFIKGLEQMNAKAFEPLELQYNTTKELSDFVKTELSADQKNRIKNLVRLIDGFQSAFSLEILATVDFIRKEKPSITEDEILKTVHSWSTRKRTMFQKHHISIALNHLKEYANEISIA